MHVETVSLNYQGTCLYPHFFLAFAESLPASSVFKFCSLELFASGKGWGRKHWKRKGVMVWGLKSTKISGQRQQKAEGYTSPQPWPRKRSSGADGAGGGTVVCWKGGERDKAESLDDGEKKP